MSLNRFKSAPLMPDGNEALVAHPNTNSGRITSPPLAWGDDDRNELAHDRSFGHVQVQSAPAGFALSI
jgi:hypothetical protein